MDVIGSSDAVLVLSSSPSRELLDALFEAGLTAVAEAPSVRAFTRVRRRSYEAIVIDDAEPGRDALETLLNIRDYDDSVPVVILSSDGPAMRPDLIDQLHVHRLDRSDSADSIAQSIQAIVDGARRAERRRLEP